jgi:hypothetical protein
LWLIGEGEKSQMRKDGKYEHDIEICMKIRENMKSAAHKRATRMGARESKLVKSPRPCRTQRAIERKPLQGCIIEEHIYSISDIILEGNGTTPLEPGTAIEEAPLSAWNAEEWASDLENDFNVDSVIDLFTEGREMK